MNNRNRKKIFAKRSAPACYSFCWPCWNGLISSGKERSPRLIKTLKLMDSVYVYAQGYEVFGTAYFVGDGFFVRNYNKMDEYCEWSEIVFVKNEEVDSFDFFKYVGGKNVFHDKYDDELFKISLSVVSIKDMKRAETVYNKRSFMAVRKARSAR